MPLKFTPLRFFELVGRTWVWVRGKHPGGREGPGGCSAPQQANDHVTDMTDLPDARRTLGERGASLGVVWGLQPKRHPAGASRDTVGMNTDHTTPMLPVPYRAFTGRC